MSTAVLDRGGETVSVPFDEKAAEGLAALASFVKGGGLRSKEGLARAEAEMGGTLSYRNPYPLNPATGQRVRGWQGSYARAHPAVEALTGRRAYQSLGAQAQRDYQKFAQPDRGDVHIDVALTNISIQYRNEMFIGTNMFPRVIVDKLTDLFFIYDAGPWLRDEVAARGAGGRYARSGYTMSQGGPYRLIEWALEHQIPDEVRDNSDSPLSPDIDASNFLMEKELIKIERQIFSLVHTSANWTTNATLSGTSQWSDFVNSDPFSDVKTARLTVLQQVARQANVMEQGVQVFETLCLHPDLLDRVKYTGTQERPALVTAQMMAELFKVDAVHVGSAIYDSSNEGAAASTLNFIWGKHAWIGHVSPVAALRTPSAGYMFTQGLFAERYREEQTRSDIARVRELFDPHVTAAGAGYRIINAIA